MEETFSNISTYGYIFIFLYSLGGGFVALAGAGVFAFMGKIDIVLATSIAIFANFLGDTLLFYMSRYNKKEFMGYLKKHRRELALAHILIKKYGNKIIFIQKFLYGVKTLVPIAIGITKYDFKIFTIYNLLSAICWGIVVGGVSFFGGKYVVEAYEVLSPYPYLFPLIAILIIGVFVLYLKRASKKRSIK